ncbi:MAG: sulfatase [Tannerellaceae bacterium]|nr:sulfatase [Tannerellaceae bacterium]
MNYTKSSLPFALALPLPLAAAGQESAKPNILVFIADDAGMDFGCYGNPNIRTPNVDRLAAQGLRFRNAYLTSPQSSPSRTSMMTGRFAHSIGTEDLHTPLNPGTQMIPSWLREAGYFSGSMLKTHWGPEGDKQFDRMIPAKYEQGDLNEEAFAHYSTFLDESRGKPFFLWVGFTDPHRPYDRNLCPQVNDPNSITPPPYLADGPRTREDLASYYDEISRMDGHIGRMLDILRQKGMSRNTLIVFLSDNGMPFPRCKGSLYDSGIQTPLIFVWDGKIRPGSEHSNGLISAVDLAATFLDLAGIKPPQDMYGKSFAGLLADPSGRGREAIFAERNWHDTDEYIRCVRTEKYKLIYNAYYHLPHGTAADLSSSPSWYELKEMQRAGTIRCDQLQIFTAPRPMVELYDLEVDPYELNNIADVEMHVKAARQLAAQLVQWQKDTRDHPAWQRRRLDKNDRITGFPLFSEIPPLIPDCPSPANPQEAP